MRVIYRYMIQFARNEDGPTAVEYAVLLALVTCICMAAIAILGESSNGAFNKTGSALKSSASGGVGFGPKEGPFGS